MKHNVVVNEVVNVTAMGFKKDLHPYPRRMEFQGVVYDFIDAGLRCLVRSGERISEILTLSDGHAYYHLRQEGMAGGWTLLSIDQ